MFSLPIQISRLNIDQGNIMEGKRKISWKENAPTTAYSRATEILDTDIRSSFHTSVEREVLPVLSQPLEVMILLHAGDQNYAQKRDNFEHPLRDNKA